MPGNNVERAPVDLSSHPVHIGIIMDGNGRWARKRNLPRTNGHNEGVKAAKRIVKAASDMKLSYLSLYTFSTENWKRAQEEVSFLMQLIKLHLRKEFEFYKKNNIKVTYSGNPEQIPSSILKELEKVKDDTCHFDGMLLNLAINYGGRDEIIRSFNRYLKEHNCDEDTPHITEDSLREYLDHPEIPDIDLIIRTGGEQRISNFFIWQSAYAELYFSKKLWPDIKAEDLAVAVRHFHQRDRRFGGAK